MLTILESLSEGNYILNDSSIQCHTFSISIASGQVQRPQTTGAEQFLLEMQVLKAEHWHQFGNTEAFQSSDPTLDHAPVQAILS